MYVFFPLIYQKHFKLNVNVIVTICNKNNMKYSRVKTIPVCITQFQIRLTDRITNSNIFKKYTIYSTVFIDDY